MITERFRISYLSSISYQLSSIPNDLQWLKQDLAKIVMDGLHLRQTEERLVPFKAAPHIANPNNCPRAFHTVIPLRRAAAAFCELPL
jgi:hypothetical protein